MLVVIKWRLLSIAAVAADLMFQFGEDATLEDCSSHPQRDLVRLS